MVGSDGRITPFASEFRARTERSVLLGLMVLRCVNLAQGAITVPFGWRSYRRPRLAATCLLCAVVESPWVGRRTWPQGALGELPPTVETAFGVAGLIALPAATDQIDRTSSMNWTNPFAVVSTCFFAVGLRRRSGMVATTMAAVAYGATVGQAARTNRGLVATAIGNTAVYGGTFGTASVLVRLLRQAADDVERARAQAVERRQRLATERERNRQHRLLHDSVLQTLEAVSGDWKLDQDAVRQRTAQETARLRRILRGEASEEGSLVATLEQLVEEFAISGLHVELIVTEVDADPRQEVAAALLDGAREAPTSVLKHARVSRVVAQARSVSGGAEVTVRDHGCGFDPATRRHGFGIDQSIMARVAEVGGRADVWSLPGRGTKVTLWGPISEADAAAGGVRSGT